MDLLKETINLMLEEDDYEEEDGWAYTPSEEELKRRAFNKAQRLFPMEYKTTEGKEIDTSNWELNDYIEKAEELANKYLDKANNEFNLSKRDMQYARSGMLDDKAMKCVICWRRWKNFIISLAKYL